VAERLEHRVAGADANPYLVMAAVLGGMLAGILQCVEPPAMIEESAHLPAQAESLPLRWEQSLALFADSLWARDYLGEAYSRAFLSMRRAECEAYHASISDLDYAWYLRSV